MIKSKFLKLNNIQKQIFIKENPINSSKTLCCICGFRLDIEVKQKKKISTWHEFVVQKEHLFLRNIYSKNDIASMKKIRDISDFNGECYRFVKIVVLLEKYLIYDDWWRKAFR